MIPVGLCLTTDTFSELNSDSGITIRALYSVTEPAAATRTFNVEINLENSDGKLRAGMTAEAEVIIGEVKAFKISPAHLNVLDDGRLSVKLVNELDRVEVIGVKLVRTAGNYAFISGIPDGAILLTSGQAYLNEGELVNYSLNEENET